MAKNLANNKRCAISTTHSRYNKGQTIKKMGQSRGASKNAGILNNKLKTNTMYNYKKPKKTTLAVNTAYQGEWIEEKINRILNNKEPITDGAPIVYTERKNGVEPQYNIKTDRFEIAVEAMDHVAKSYMAKREENIKNFENKLNKQNQKLEDKNKPQDNKETGGQPVGGTENQ